jgi:plastocyanin
MKTKTLARHVFHPLLASAILLTAGSVFAQIVITTPPPSGICLGNVVVSGLHYPSQTCAQSTPNFLSTLSTSFHFKSKCTLPNQLLGVTNASCQNAPIPGFPTGSVYQGTACCGTVAATGKLTLKKVLVPPADPGKFTIAISTSSGTLLGNFLNGSNGATAGPMTVPAGNYVVSETAGSTSPTTLAQYTSVISGAGCATNGAVTIAAGDNKVCTITNTRIPASGTLTLKKVLVPPADPGKFTIAISTSSGTLLGNFLNGSNGATAGPMTVPAGNYVVSETAGSTSPTTLAQYTSVISGAGCATNGAVTIAAGDNKVCTITNTRIPASGTGTLTLKKVLVPATDPGKFTLAISTSSGTLLGNFLNGGNGATAGPMPVPAGNYVVSETAGSTSPTTLAQYTSVISGVGCATNGAVTIATGDNKVCTITNTRITGTWPNTATVNIYNPMTPFGPQSVNIAAGGTVTFNNVNSGANWTITWLSGPVAFPPIPLANNATGVTVPLTVPGTYTYVISGTPSITVPGQIIVH